MKCAACREKFEALERIHGLVAEAFEPATAAEEAGARVLPRLRDARARREAEFRSPHTHTPLEKFTMGMIQSWKSRKVKTVGLAAVGAMIVFIVLSLISGNQGTGLAFAEVLAQVREIQESRPYSCVHTVKYDGKPDYTYEWMRPDLTRRREVRPDGTILVFDLSQAPVRVLTLFPDGKTAVEKTYVGSEPAKDPDLLGIVASMLDGDAEDLGTKEVEGRTAQRFHRPDAINDFTIWADPGTGLPIRIELRQDAAERTLVMSERISSGAFIFRSDVTLTAARPAFP